MSFLKNILKPFVEFKPEDETSAQQNETAQTDAAKQTINAAQNTANSVANNTAAAPVSSTATSQTNNSGKAAITNDYHQYFENLIEEANAKNPLFQGTDFKEFIDSKIDVEGIADEAMRYKTAFNVLKRTGLTKERLITTGQEYMKLVEVDLKGFGDAYNQQYKAEVEQKEQLLQKKAEELKAFNDRIAALNQEMQQLTQQIVQNKEKLDKNKNAFISAGEEKKSEIKNELQKITQYF